MRKIYIVKEQTTCDVCNGAGYDASSKSGLFIRRRVRCGECHGEGYFFKDVDLMDALRRLMNERGIVLKNLLDR